MDRKENVVYLTDVIPHVKTKLPTKHQVKMFGYDHAFKLITLSTILTVGWFISTIITNI